ncbi:MAG TPA: thioesterase family protein [Longimicrobiales bacterium]
MKNAPSNAYTTDIRVRYAETDQMGVAYHAHYLVWCEVARTGLIRELGRSYAELEKDGLILAVADARVRYHASARYDDRVRITCWPSTVQSRAVTFEYLLEKIGEHDTDRDEPVRLATASTMLIALDKAGATRRFQPELYEVLRGAVPR